MTHCEKQQLCRLHYFECPSLLLILPIVVQLLDSTSGLPLSLQSVRPNVRASKLHKIIAHHYPMCHLYIVFSVYRCTMNTTIINNS